MDFILDYIDRTVRNMGFAGFAYEVVTVEKERNSPKILIPAYNDYYFLNSYFFPQGTEGLKFSIHADNAFDEFVHQQNYAGLSDLKLTNFYTGLIALETYATSRLKRGDMLPPSINTTSFLFNFIRVVPFLNNDEC